MSRAEEVAVGAAGREGGGGHQAAGFPGLVGGIGRSNHVTLVFVALWRLLLTRTTCLGTVAEYRQSKTVISSTASLITRWSVEISRAVHSGTWARLKPIRHIVDR